jgi:hypothetical protein
MIHHHGMVNDQINGGLWVNFLWVLAQIFHGIAHGGQINHRRNTCEILHQNARRTIRDFFFIIAFLKPLTKGFDVFGHNRTAVFET